MANKEKFKFHAASYVILVKDRKVLLSRRFQTGWQDGNYSLPAGHIDGGETVANAAIREAKEEIGITLKPEDLVMSHVSHRISTSREYFDFFFTAKKWQGEIKNCEPEKCDDLAWFPLKKLPKNLVPYIGEVLAYMEKKVFFSETTS